MRQSVRAAWAFDAAGIPALEPLKSARYEGLSRSTGRPSWCPHLSGARWAVVRAGDGHLCERAADERAPAHELPARSVFELSIDAAVSTITPSPDPRSMT